MGYRPIVGNTCQAITGELSPMQRGTGKARRAYLLSRHSAGNRAQRRQLKRLARKNKGF